MRVLGQVPDIHTLVYHMGYHPISRWGDGRFTSAAFLESLVDALTQAQQASGKPVMLALRPAPDLDGMKDFFTVQKALTEAGFPVFHSLDRIAGAMSRVIAWNKEGATTLNLQTHV